MQRNTLIAVAAGLLSAAMHLPGQWSILGFMFLTLFAPLPLFATGLSIGLGAVVIAALTAIIAVAAITDVAHAIVFLASNALPVVMVVRFALLGRPAADGNTEWYPPGLLLAWITLYGVGAFTALAVLTGTGPDGLQSMISANIEEIRSVFRDSKRNTPQVNQILESLKLIFPFLVTEVWLFLMVCNSVLAQKLVTARGINQRTSPDLRTLVLPQWLGLAVVAAAVVALLGSGWLGFLAINTALILCVPYFLLGLTVLHWVTRRLSAKPAILVTAYLVIVLLGWPALVVFGLGFAENWIGLRNKFGGSGRSNERNE
jgi:hypothetical protein